MSPEPLALQADSLPTKPLGKPFMEHYTANKNNGVHGGKRIRLYI